MGLWGPVLAEAALLFYLSSLRRVVFVERGWDKAAHAGAYAVLAALVIRAFHGGLVPLRLRPTLLAVGVTMLYGITDEVHQVFVPGRDASVLDLLADLTGALIAVAILRSLLGRWSARTPARPAP